MDEKQFSSLFITKDIQTVWQIPAADILSVCCVFHDTFTRYTYNFHESFLTRAGLASCIIVNTYLLCN